MHSFLVVSRPKLFTSESANLHLINANSMAKCCPIPLEAPVIQTTLPFKVAVQLIVD